MNEFADHIVGMKRVLVRAAASIVVLLTVIAWGPATAQLVKELPPPTAAQMVPAMVAYRAKLLVDDAAVDALIEKTYGESLDEAHLAVSRKYIRTIMGSDAYLGRIATAVASAAKAELGLKDSMAVVANSIISLQLKGLNRMPTDTKVKFAQYMADVIRSVSPSTCEAVFKGSLSLADSGALERHYLLGLPIEKFAAALNLYQDAVLAELNDFPGKPIVTEEESRLAKAAYRVAVRKRMIATLDTETISYFAKEGMNGDATAVCPVMLATFEAMVDMDEPFKSWQLTRFIDEMQ